MKTLKSCIRVLLKSGLTTIGLLLAARLLIVLTTRHQILPLAEISPAPVAIVFGAGLWPDGSPTPILRDRVSAAVELYQNGQVKKLLFSGDNRFVNYNEPEAMRQFALSLGVPEENIVLDYAGRRTYDTCFRAKAIFQVDQVILVTQHYHLPRALYLCRQFGIQAVGYSADKRVYRKHSILYWNLREIAATAVALWEIHISHPLPILGNPEPIFP